MGFHINWKQLVSVVASTVLPAVLPQLTPAIPYIIDGIQKAEDMKGKTSKEKLDAAVQIANDGANAANNITGKDHVDISAMNTAIASGIGAVVNATNAFHKDQPEP